MTDPIVIHAAHDPSAATVKARNPDPCLMTIFGVSGDLTKRKVVPALYNLALSGSLPSPFAAIGFSRSATSPDALRAQLREATAKFSRTKPLDDQVWDAFAAGFDCVPGNVDDPAAYTALRAKIEALERSGGTKGNRLFYMATPPSAFPTILRNLHASGLLPGNASAPWTRVVIEKPFGADLATARDLNALAAEVMSERQTYRIDHYLGKETVQNILLFRFGNTIWEPLWNRKHIDHVQITAAEEIGVEGRGAFYDQTGVLRDIVQNHLLQVLAVCAMEPPATFSADDVRDEKVQVLRSLRHFAGETDVLRNVVPGQYRGYRDEPDVAKDSRTPTYVALRVMIDNWRWQGVPFYLRAGKGLARRSTEIAIHFQTIPLSLFGREDACQRIEPNVLRIRLQPDEGISLCFAAKVPGDDLVAGAVTMDFSYARAFEKGLSDAYERLILDCMRGDATLYARRDEIEWAWSFVDPILDAWNEDRTGLIPVYERGSAGPLEAEALVLREGRRWEELA